MRERLPAAGKRTAHHGANGITSHRIPKALWPMSVGRITLEPTMRPHLIVFTAAVCALAAGSAVAQDSTKKGARKADKTSEAPKPTKPSAFWAPAAPFE